VEQAHRAVCDACAAAANLDVFEPSSSADAKRGCTLSSTPRSLFTGGTQLEKAHERMFVYWVDGLQHDVSGLWLFREQMAIRVERDGGRHGGWSKPQDHRDPSSAHLTQKDLAHASRIGITRISGIEQGRVNPTLRTIDAIALGLELKSSELLVEVERGAARLQRQ
jgi:DNA-binding XRE family transcriptional regulator